jgi:outer membrane protein TolC
MARFWLRDFAPVRYLLVPLLLLIGPAAEAANEPRALTLREAAEYAVAHSPALATSLSEVAIANAHVLEAAGIDDVSVDASAGWVRTRTNVVPGAPAAQPDVDDLSLGAGISRSLPTGGKLNLRLNTDLVRAVSLASLGSDASTTSSQTLTPTLVLTLSHPLLRGAGVATARAGRRRAQVNLDTATLERDQVAAVLLRDVALAYWELGYATAELAIRTGSLEQAREQLRIVEANIAAGKQPPSASAEVEVAIALRQEDVLLADQGLLERSIELERLIGMPITAGKQSMVAADSPEPEHQPIDPDRSLEIALARNPQLSAARSQTLAAGIEVDVTRNGLLPQLDLSLGGGPSGSASGTQRAFEELLRFGGYSVQAGLAFSQSLERRAALGQAEAARLGVRKARLAESDIALQIAGAIGKAVHAVTSASQRTEVLARATDFASLDLSAEKARFEVGRATNFDVLRRQEELAQARLRHTRSKVDQLQSRAVLEALTGEILGRYARRP